MVVNICLYEYYKIFFISLFISETFFLDNNFFQRGTELFPLGVIADFSCAFAETKAKDKMRV